MQKFFLEVRQHSGVSFQTPDINMTKSFDTFLLNLTQCARIYFDEHEDYEGDVKIHFHIGNEICTLGFEKSAMGEYHRYQREIETYQISESSP